MAHALLCSISPFSSLTGLGHEALNCQLDVLRHARQEAAFVPSDGVSGHTESVSEFALSETEEEPLTTKLSTGQPEARLPEGAHPVNPLGWEPARLARALKVSLPALVTDLRFHGKIERRLGRPRKNIQSTK